MTRSASSAANRRRFLRRVLGWGGAALVLPSLCAVRGAGKGKKVIVIGAGLSGLAAAATLKASEFEVTVLEARDRLGGRVWTDRTVGHPIELGAQFIQGMKGNPLTSLASRAGLHPEKTDDESLKVYDFKGTLVDEEKLARLDDEYKELIELIEDKTAKLDDDISVAEAIQRFRAKTYKDPLFIWDLARLMETETGGPIEQLSAWEWHGSESFSGSDAVVPEGFDRFAEYLAADLDIQFRHPVRAIAHDGNGARVTTERGEFKADYAVVTLPLGVLKKNAIEFKPALSDTRQEAVRNVGVGAFNTVALVWDNPFWDLRAQYFGSVAPEKGRYPVFFNCRAFGRLNVLLTHAVGTHARRMESQTDAQIQEDIMEQLNLMFPGRTSLPVRMIVTRWGNDPYAGGAWSFPTVATTRAHISELGQPIANRLFFAGEHTSLQYRGTAHGAYLSGLREAQRIQAFNS